MVDLWRWNCSILPTCTHFSYLVHKKILIHHLRDIKGHLYAKIKFENYIIFACRLFLVSSFCIFNDYRHPFLYPTKGFWELDYYRLLGETQIPGVFRPIKASSWSCMAWCPHALDCYTNYQSCSPHLWLLCGKLWHQTWTVKRFIDAAAGD